ncbi:hypothetical protein Tco_0519190 [Tanacetum coccineum]
MLPRQLPGSFFQQVGFNEWAGLVLALGNLIRISLPGSADDQGSVGVVKCSGGGVVKCSGNGYVKNRQKRSKKDKTKHEIRRVQEIEAEGNTSDTYDTSNATLAILKDVIGCDTWNNDPRAEISGFRSVWNEWMGLEDWDASQALDPSFSANK